MASPWASVRFVQKFVQVNALVLTTICPSTRAGSSSWKRSEDDEEKEEEEDCDQMI